MARRPNVLWLMSDQHNANCAGFAAHPNVETPNMDRIADEGVVFTRAFCNNPICSPSRICFMTGQYCHTHRMFGNDHSEIPEANPNTLACQFRRHGYQTAVIGKAHMVRRWDEDGFERIRYTDLCDATHLDPMAKTRRFASGIGATPGVRCRRFARAISGWYFTVDWMRENCTITARIRVRSQMFGPIQRMQMCVLICSHIL